MAVQDDKVKQVFDSEPLLMVGGHSQRVKASNIKSVYGLKGCINLSSSTAVSRFNVKKQEGHYGKQFHWKNFSRHYLG